ncbi:MAG: DUF559 domain-containing protein [Planctomycetales bacterium]
MPSRRQKRVSDKTRTRAGQLRQNTTGPERLLWSVLRSRQLGGLKFRRQHPIEPYIVDFYCAEARLIVELDGESHDERQQYDTIRGEYLQKLGFEIVRVANDDVFEDLDEVAEYIHLRARGRTFPE